MCLFACMTWGWQASSRQQFSEVSRFPPNTCLRNPQNFRWKQIGENTISAERYSEKARGSQRNPEVPREIQRFSEKSEVFRGIQRFSEYYFQMFKGFQRDSEDSRETQRKYFSRGIAFFSLLGFSGFASLKGPCESRVRAISVIRFKYFRAETLEVS